MKITGITAREIYDSRGWPTISCTLTLDNGSTVVSSVPTGKSKGIHEALEVRDRGARLHGLGVLRAIQNIETIIAPALIGKEPKAIAMDMQMIDLDGTENKSRLGANAMLAVSMAIYRAEALMHDLELFEFIAYLMGNETVTLPLPLVNIINGGMHANNRLQLQEFMIVPASGSNFREAFESCVMVYHELEILLDELGYSTALGDEGGFAPQFDNVQNCLEILTQALERCREKYNVSAVMALDCAASTFYHPRRKLYSWQGDLLTSHEVIEQYKEIVGNYPIYSLEDGLAQDDQEGWELLMQQLGDQIQIVGDDLFATNIYRIEEGLQKNLANAVLIKPNQVGTITQTLQAIKFCKSQNITVIVSHRSGETDDSFIADLAVGANASQIKAGACARGERTAKYNRLLAIEDMLTLTLMS